MKPKNQRSIQKILKGNQAIKEQARNLVTRIPMQTPPQEPEEDLLLQVLLVKMEQVP
jgi:hypothetical protein